MPVHETEGFNATRFPCLPLRFLHPWKYKRGETTRNQYRLLKHELKILFPFLCPCPQVSKWQGNMLRPDVDFPCKFWLSTYQCKKVQADQNVAHVLRFWYCVQKNQNHKRGHWSLMLIPYAHFEDDETVTQDKWKWQLILCRSRSLRKFKQSADLCSNRYSCAMSVSFACKSMTHTTHVWCWVLCQMNNRVTVAHSL